MVVHFRPQFRAALVGLGMVLAAGCSSQAPSASTRQKTVGAVEAGKPVVMQSSARNQRVRRGNTNSNSYGAPASGNLPVSR